MKRVCIVLNNTCETAGIFEDVMREMGVDFFVVDLQKGDSLPKELEFTHLLVMGGADSAYDKSAKVLSELVFISECIENEIPYFGVCLGMQLLAYTIGADVKRCESGEYGFGDFKCEIVEDDLIFKGLDAKEFAVFQLHGDCVQPHKNLKLIARGNHYPVQFVKYGDRFYGTQAHIEIQRDKLEVWLEHDKELKAIPKEEQLAIYDRLKDEMAHSSRVIFGNFLQI